MSEEINDVVAKADNIVDSKIIQKLNQDKDKHDDDMIKILKMGCELFKYKRNGKKYKRHFYLDPDELTIKYTGSRKFWRAQKLVEIPDIKEIRMGPNTHTFRALANKVKANLAFSLILGNKHDSLDLVAKSPEIKDQWISALRYVVSRYKNMEQEKEHEKWAIDHFNKADINKDGGLSFEETLQLLNHMNINMDKRYAKKLFDVSDINMTRTKTGEDVLDQKEFLNFYRLLIRRPEIVDIIHKYSKNGSSFLEPEELQEFMIKEQKQNDINLEQCKKLIQTYDKTTKEGTMSIEGMRCMLVSRDQALFNKNYLELYQDMTRPLSDYYINSSHNTYLSEDQLIGESSVENYIKALREGCRCVEIDVWNGVDGDPIVYHGHTLTAMIKFVDIIKAISTYAFETSPYPLILSLENHCSIDQQKLMAHYLKTILGDKIYAEEIMEGDFLPSPESLKERYVIKGKMLDIPYKSEEVVSEEDEAAEIDSEIVLKDLKKKPQSKMIKLAKELSDLTFLRSTHFKGVGQRGKCNCICSFSELKAISMISEDARLFADYNTTNLSRIYPNGIRTDSSNFDPMLFWKAGCQIVAMNYQSDDKKMQLYHAKFRDNGGMGYLLKPDYLLSNYDETSPTERQEKLLKLKIISAQQLPKPYRNVHDKDVIDPYVKIEVIGFKTTQKAKTSIIANNGFNPVWNEAFEFVIDDPQSAILRFVVKDFNSSSKNDFIGQFTIPFKCLMEGCKFFKLLNKHNQSLSMGSFILVHVDISVIITPIYKIKNVMLYRLLLSLCTRKSKTLKGTTCQNYRIITYYRKITH
ncbi:unnamed protein product [Gordionus sp. m RMFG-2023]|uniref:1-phosphatidylinositol 4,5-bisphosphate phosphodiesterase eta-2-like isoform X1 n=1 Tax=Gordionus sp. m RMFG-2023 TaxID=3053472 RepID=UPI0030E52F50